MKILAVDYGDSRTGLATCDRTEFLTSPITPQITLKARNKVAARVCEVAKEIGAELIVIGLPLNMDGTEGERAAKSRKLATTVKLWSGLPVRMWDERQTPAPPPTCWTRAAPTAANGKKFWTPSAPLSSWTTTWPGGKITPGKFKQKGTPQSVPFVFLRY